MRYSIHTYDKEGNKTGEVKSSVRLNMSDWCKMWEISERELDGLLPKREEGYTATDLWRGLNKVERGTLVSKLKGVVEGKMRITGKYFNDGGVCLFREEQDARDRFLEILVG